MADDAKAPALPTRKELLELYKIAVEEYRFQVKLNADRSRDYVVLNSAIIAAAITLLGQAKLPALAGLVFAIGLVVALLSILGTDTQHGYYRDTKNAKQQLERQLGIADLTLVKTKPTGSRYRRFGSVTRFNFVILSLLAVLDGAGVAYILVSAVRPDTTPAITKPVRGQKIGTPQAPKAKGTSLTAPKNSSSGPVPPSRPTPPPP
jgi:hypothetical protein